ncbi:hypothetical protein SNC81_21520 [Escherichia coli]|nr:hypothetical protein [Escherichia coli]
MNDKELKKTPPQTRKGQRKKIAHEHESERFAPVRLLLRNSLRSTRKSYHCKPGNEPNLTDQIAHQPANRYDVRAYV